MTVDATILAEARGSHAARLVRCFDAMLDLAQHARGLNDVPGAANCVTIATQVSTLLFTLDASAAIQDDEGDEAEDSHGQRAGDWPELSDPLMALDGDDDD